MNIFVVDNDPTKSAMSLCNKHVVKMPLETAQLLCTAIHELTGASTPYKPCFKNHPCGIWTRQSEANFDWLIEHGFALCDAYKIEYGKEHKCREVIQWTEKNRPSTSAFKITQKTDHPKCMPKEFMVEDVVTSYRNYYIGAKASFAKWNKRSKPLWFENVYEQHNQKPSL
jgi:hypothetical protein